MPKIKCPKQLAKKRIKSLEKKNINLQVFSVDLQDAILGDYLTVKYPKTSLTRVVDYWKAAVSLGSILVPLRPELLEFYSSVRSGHSARHSRGLHSARHSLGNQEFPGNTRKLLLQYLIMGKRQIKARNLVFFNLWRNIVDFLQPSTALLFASVYGISKLDVYWHVSKKDLKAQVVYQMSLNANLDDIVKIVDDECYDVMWETCLEFPKHPQHLKNVIVQRIQEFEIIKGTISAEKNALLRDRLSAYGLLDHLLEPICQRFIENKSSVDVEYVLAKIRLDSLLAFNGHHYGCPCAQELFQQVRHRVYIGNESWVEATDAVLNAGLSGDDVDHNNFVNAMLAFAHFMQQLELIPDSDMEDMEPYFD